ncbi:flavoprotein [Streptomyces prasinopilosus]|uniref:Flavoprotein n=1 Tax=Streptomyces prasinopilosus TaxID=67344 RepID=A0A1G7AP63_9ACTN|nr:flavoprotein [Streptomyces prasinopilosus]SDE15676.1 Flavoprotein [Streptomyces prasinopilosus]
MSSTAPPASASTTPAFTGRTLLLVASGAVNTVHLPYWLTWLRKQYPDVTVKVVATRSALRFTTLQALSALTSHEAILDAWPDEPRPTALHVDLVEWADSVAVYPASMHYVSRAALGLADSPSLLAVHSTDAPVVIAPSLPPRIEENPVYARHVKALEERSNVAVAPTQPAVSVTTGRKEARSSAPMWTVLAALENLRTAAGGSAEEKEERN